MVRAARPLRIWIILLAGRQEPSPLEKPPRFIGALPRGTDLILFDPMSARPFAVGGRLAVPSVYIAAEPGSVGAPLVGARVEGRHEACPYVVIERKASGDPSTDGPPPGFRIHPAERRVGQALPLHPGLHSPVRTAA